MDGDGAGWEAMGKQGVVPPFPPIGLRAMPVFESCSHLKDLKASDVQDSNEELSGQLCVQGLIDPGHQPPEQSVIGGLG